MIRALVLLVLTFGVTVLVTGCGGGTGDATTAPEPAAAVTASEVTEAAPPATALPPIEEAEAGTRDNPVPLGVPAKVGDWEVTVTEVNADAAALIAAENQFNDPPADGFSFVLLGAKATYVGEESGSISGNLMYKVVGADGNSFSDTCGVTPNAITDSGETFSGATVNGNFCFSVETSQIDGATLSIEEFLGDSRAFFALQ